MDENRDKERDRAAVILTVAVCVLLLVFYVATQPRKVQPSRDALDAGDAFHEDSIRGAMHRVEMAQRDSIEWSDRLQALSPAARRILKAHPNWSPEACGRLGDREVWVGMTYDMLLFLRGRPDRTNVSNYGRGNRYQYCWTGQTPHCFYDENADGVIDAFN